MNQRIRLYVSLVLSLLTHVFIIYYLPSFSHSSPETVWVSLVEIKREALVGSSELLIGRVAKSSILKGELSINLSKLSDSTSKKSLEKKVALPLKPSTTLHSKPKERVNRNPDFDKNGNRLELTSKEVSFSGGTERVENLNDIKAEEFSLVPPKPISTKEPGYPTLAKKMRYEGIVVLDIEVLPDGSVGEIKIVESSGYEILDKSALEEIKKWRFIPAYRNGKPVKSIVRQKVVFRLK